MNPKPADLLLGILEFFGILIPGAFAAFLLYLTLLAATPYCPDWSAYFPGWVSGTNLDWALIFFISIILGHLLHGLSELIDWCAGIRLLGEKAKEYWEAATGNYGLRYPASDLANLSDIEKIKKHFYVAFAYIRVHDPAALAELERQAADYKLFRSLTLLMGFCTLLWGLCVVASPRGIFPLKIADTPADTAIWSGAVIIGLLVLFAAAFLAAALRYWQLIRSTYVLAFELYIQVYCRVQKASGTALAPGTISPGVGPQGPGPQGPGP